MEKTLKLLILIIQPKKLEGINRKDIIGKKITDIFLEVKNWDMLKPSRKYGGPGILNISPVYVQSQNYC